jgi:hypothetical protein
VTYAIFFALGAALYALTPTAGKFGSTIPFVACYAVILSMYGGGFATIPAYLRDRFGPDQVGAIHGRLLTAWSLAGIAGPVLMNSVRQGQIDRGVPKADAYTLTMYLLAGLLAVGFACNMLIRGKEVDRDAGATDSSAIAPQDLAAVSDWPALAFRWAWVGIPLAWGVAQTAIASLSLFG